MASGSVFAQNATKAEVDKLVSQVDALSQKVSQLESKATELEATIERVVTENMNLVEQLNVKTVTSCTDTHGITWDIVKVEPNADNDVNVTLRISNNSGMKKKLYCVDSGQRATESYALDSNTNLNNNKYGVKIYIQEEFENGFPKNLTFSIKNVPNTCAYLSMIQLKYDELLSNKRNNTIKFTGVHIPW